MKTKQRRILAGGLIVLGALLMWLAPENGTSGLLLIALGVTVEIVGIALEKKA